MCGIIAYTGKQNAASILIDGLLRLEYRGYDSAGIALQEESTLTHITKVVGPVSLLANKTSSFSESYSSEWVIRVGQLMVAQL